MHTIAFYYNEFPRISISNLTSLLRIVNKGAMPSLIIKRSIHHSMEDTKENYRGKREPPLQEATFIHTLGTPLAYIKITRSMISYTTIRIQTKTCASKTYTIEKPKHEYEPQKSVWGRERSEPWVLLWKTTLSTTVCALANGLVEAVSSLLGISNGIVKYW